MSLLSQPPVGRLAPSPTGRLHLGNAFSFLMAWCGTASENGRLILRIEDIDPDRSRPEFALGIMEDLQWLGLNWDEGPQGKDLQPDAGPHGPYIQSRRLALYTAAVNDLQARGLVYPCFCTRKELRMLASAPHIGDEGVPYPGTCRGLGAAEQAERMACGKHFSLRLNTQAAMQAALSDGASGCRRTAPSGKTEEYPLAETGETEISLLSFTDAVLGPQSFSMKDCGGDFALRRSDGVFAYQLAVTVDDAAMGVSQVVRGEDLLLSTPRQLLLLRLLGAPAPCYAHVPLLHDHGGERLAKRHKSLELRALRESGVSPETVIGYLAHLAGFLDTPRDINARDLLPFFSFKKLTGKQLIVDGNAFDLPVLSPLKL